MPAFINHQSPLQTPTHTICANRPNQRLAHHLSQENRQCIIIPESRNLNSHLHPRPMTPTLSCVLILLIVHSMRLVLVQRLR